MSDITEDLDLDDTFDTAGVEAILQDDPETPEQTDATDPADAGEGDDAGSGQDADTGTAAHVDGSEGGDLPTEDIAPEPDPTIPSGDGPATDWFAPLEQRLGRTLDDGERANAARLMADLLSAEQTRQQAVWDAMYGQPAARAPAPAAEPAPDPLADLDELVDPEAAAILRQVMSPLQQEVAALREADAARVAAAHMQEMAQRVTAIDVAGAAWRDKYSIDDSTWDSIVARSPQYTPMLDAFAQGTNGDYAAATGLLLDHIYWTDEALREQEMQRRMEAERVTQREDYVRQTRAAAVSTAGSETAAPAVARSADEELLNALSVAMSDGVPS